MGAGAQQGLLESRVKEAALATPSRDGASRLEVRGSRRVYALTHPLSVIVP